MTPHTLWATATPIKHLAPASPSCMQPRNRPLLLPAALMHACHVLGRALQTDDLLAKSSANKALNDKKRLATSYANLARTR